ncbi:histone-lysine N-methyltransferase SETMAR [Trichonephila clavipes]|nr:histone-lysine N-methyltransferase SETMAR [Trichonephila clavipes]
MDSRRREDGHTSYHLLLNMQASKKEQRGVIRFLAVEGVGGREMHRRMKAHHGITSKMIMEVNDLFLDNRRITMDEIHRLLGISVDTTHTIMHQH